MLGVEDQSCSIERQSASLKCHNRRSLCSDTSGGIQTEHKVAEWSATWVKTFEVIICGTSQEEIEEMTTTSRGTNTFLESRSKHQFFRQAFWRNVTTQSKPMRMINVHIASTYITYTLIN